LFYSFGLGCVGVRGITIENGWRKGIHLEGLVINIFVMVHKDFKEKGMMFRWIIVAAAFWILLANSCVISTSPAQEPVESPAIETQNNPPTIKTSAAENKVSILSKSEILCESEDPDGDELTYSWSANGGTIEGQGQIINWTAPGTPGDYTIAVSVDDGQGGIATQSVTIQVTDKPNQPPAISSFIIITTRPVGPITIDPSVEQLDRPSISVRVLTPSVITCIAEDPDGDELSYTWTATDGKITDEEGRKVVWIAPTNAIRHFVTVEVSDGRGGSSSAKVAFDVSCCK
jgi:hypothetical protein